jgi:hypothetical protein
MKRPTRVPNTQLAFPLEPAPPLQLAQETREALITALADLLLEAYDGTADAPTRVPGEGHES